MEGLKSTLFQELHLPTDLQKYAVSNQIHLFINIWLDCISLVIDKVVVQFQLHFHCQLSVLIPTIPFEKIFERWELHLKFWRLKLKLYDTYQVTSFNIGIFSSCFPIIEKPSYLW